MNVANENQSNHDDQSDERKLSKESMTAQSKSRQTVSSAGNFPALMTVCNENTCN